MLIVILLLVFAILNPLLTPFVLIYFSVEFGESNSISDDCKILLTRIVHYKVVIRNQVSRAKLFVFVFEMFTKLLQLIHVYAKNYEGNGAHILIRLMRYSLDGLILAQVIFMGFLGVNKKEVHVALTAVMLAATIVVKLV